MTLPGLALFYGGFVRAKNVLNIFMQCFMAAGAVGLIWILVGYSLAFSAGDSLFVGNWPTLLDGVTMDSVTPGYGATPARYIPEYLFIMFQAMFAIITPALILGAVAERMKFLGVPRLHQPLARAGLLPARVHGLGRRLDLQGGRDRLRGRPGRPHVEWHFGARRGAHGRQAARLR